MKIKATQRKLLGKKVKHLRTQGQVPASVYGPKREAMSVNINPKEFKKLFDEVGYSTLFDMQIDDAKTSKVLVKEVQQNPLTDELLHVSFYEVNMTASITADIPIEIVGEALAVKSNVGILITPVNSVSIQCLPTDLPSEFKIDISEFAEVGDAFKIEDIKLPNGVEFSADVSTSTSIVYIAAPQKAVIEEVKEEETEAGEESEEKPDTDKTEENEDSKK